MNLLRIYLQRLREAHPHAMEADRPLFPDIRSGKAYKRATPKKCFIEWVRDLLAKAGYDPSKFSGHSFRAGGATDLYAGGANPRTIKLSGRWASEAYVLYLRDHPVDTAWTIADCFKAVVEFGRDIGQTE